MPVISAFFGIIVQMYFDEHNPPHIHIRYQGDSAVFNINDGEMTFGTLSDRNKRLVQAWIELHREELMANWDLCRNDERPERIDPLR